MKKLFLIPLLLVLSSSLAQQSNLEFCREKYPNSTNFIEARWNLCEVNCYSSSITNDKNFLGKAIRPNRFECDSLNYPTICIAGACHTTPLSAGACLKHGEYSLPAIWNGYSCQVKCYRENVIDINDPDFIYANVTDGEYCTEDIFSVCRNGMCVDKCKDGSDDC